MRYNEETTEQNKKEMLRLYAEVEDLDDKNNDLKEENDRLKHHVKELSLLLHLAYKKKQGATAEDVTPSERTSPEL